MGKRQGAFWLAFVCLGLVVFAPWWNSLSTAQEGVILPASQVSQGLWGKRMRFEHLSVDEGLSQSSVYAILQDRTGFIWVATADGLNKYDGYDFTVYRHDPDDPYSLSDNLVWTLYEDKAGVLWVGTNGGLNRFDPDSGQFTRFRHDPADPYSLSGNVISQIYEDSTGMLWVGTWGGGLDRFDRQSEQFTRYRHNPADPDSLSSDTIGCLYEDSSGRLWVGTWGGLDLFDRKKEQFVHYRHDPESPYSLSYNAVRVVFEDQDGNLWVGTAGGGLNKFDPKSGRFLHYMHAANNPYSLNSDVVWDIYQDSRGVLWVGTENGLEQFDFRGGRFHHYVHDADDPYSLGGETVYTIYEDRAAVLWVGTDAGGVNKFDRSTERFCHYAHYSGDPSSLNHNQVQAIFRDRDGVLWVGTEGGLNWLYPGTEFWGHYVHDPEEPNSLSDSHILALFEDSHDVLWVGTRNGLNRFDWEERRFIHYRHDPKDPHTLSHDCIQSFYEDREGTLWIGTCGGGLNRLDRETGQFVHYLSNTKDENSLWGSVVYSIYQDEGGGFWIGTNVGGLNWYDPTMDQFAHYVYDAQNPNSLSNNTVFSILGDPSGVLWLGTSGGLNRFDPVSETFALYREKEGLPNDVIYGILSAQDGFLWMSTNRGLSRFDLETETFRNYGPKDGLQSNEFNLGAYHGSPDGEMFFGGINGFNAFYPDQIADHPYVPPIVLTSFTQGGQPVDLDRAVASLQEVTLRWPNNYFEFEFAALSYRQPEKNRYAYRLEKFDEKWNETGTRRFGRYTNLPGGIYTLQIKGANCDGVWNQEGVSIQIEVVPPFWQTWWFSASAALVLVFSVIVGYRLRVKSVETRNRDLAEQVAQRTAELRQEMEQRKQTEEALRQSEMEKAVAAERSRLARELHDAVTQTLFSASLIAEILPEMWESDRQEARDLLHELRQLSRGALAEMRTLLLELRPSTLLETPLGDLLSQLGEAITGREGLPVQVLVETRCALPPEVHVALYRIAQEALNNVIRHARASRVMVKLCCIMLADGAEAIELTVADDGCGFDQECVPPDHLGVSIMRERAQAVGAILEIQSESAKGTEVRVVWSRKVI